MSILKGTELNMKKERDEINYGSRISQFLDPIYYIAPIDVYAEAGVIRFFVNRY